MTRLSFVTLMTLSGLFFGCGDDGASSNNPACSSASDCGGGSVCVKIGAVSTCQLQCSVSGNECSGQASCSGLGSMSVNFCDDRPAPSASNPPKAEEQPRLPCKTDDECKVFAPAAICASWQGTKDCTMPCQDSSVCNAPAVAGIKIEFLGCQTDEAMPSRKACLPKAECFQDMMKCITLPSTFPDMGVPQDGAGGFPDFF